jgi:hypothetical protein
MPADCVPPLPPATHTHICSPCCTHTHTTHSRRRAIVSEVVGLGVEDEDRKRTWMGDAEEAARRGSVETARAVYGVLTSTFPGGCVCVSVSVCVCVCVCVCRCCNTRCVRWEVCVRVCGRVFSWCCSEVP